MFFRCYSTSFLSHYISLLGEAYTAEKWCVRISPNANSLLLVIAAPMACTVLSPARETKEKKLQRHNLSSSINSAPELDTVSLWHILSLELMCCRGMTRAIQTQSVLSYRTKMPEALGLSHLWINSAEAWRVTFQSMAHAHYLCPKLSGFYYFLKNELKQQNSPR